MSLSVHLLSYEREFVEYAFRAPGGSESTQGSEGTVPGEWAGPAHTYALSSRPHPVLDPGGLLSQTGLAAVREAHVCGTPGVLGWTVRSEMSLTC